MSEGEVSGMGKSSETSGWNGFFTKIQSEWFIRLALFVTVLVWFGFWAHIGTDPHHDGILMKPAADVAAGQMLFRDTFTQYGALTTLLQAWACVIFGTKLMTIRWLTVFFYAGATVLVWRISEPILRGWFRIVPIFLIFSLAPFYFWTFHSWSSVYALFFLLLTCWLMQLGLQKRFSDWIWCLAGGVSILPFWCRQPMGLVFPAACLIVLASHWRFHETWQATLRRFLLFVGGAVGVCGIFLFWLAQNHAFSAFWDQSIRMAFGFVSGRTRLWSVGSSATPGTGGSTGSLLWNLMNLFFFRKALWGCFSGVVTGWFIYLTVWGIRKKNLSQEYWLLLPVVLLSGVSLHQYYPVPCIRHLYWAAFPAFLVYARTLQAWLRDWHGLTFIKGLKRTGGIALLLALACWLIHDCPKNDRRYSVMASIYDLNQLVTYHEPGFLDGVWMMPWEAKAWDDLKEAVRAIPEPQRNEPVLNFTSNGLYLLEFPNQKNWHPQYVNWGNGLDPNFRTKLVLMLLGGRCPVVTMGDALKQIGEQTYERLSEEEILWKKSCEFESFLFEVAKSCFPDREIVEYPQFHAYGKAVFRFVVGYEYSVVIFAPTGEKVKRNRNEKLTFEKTK